MDTADSYRIRRIGVYLARQTRLVTWTLAELTAALSGGRAPALPELRAEFAEQVTATLEREDPDYWAGRWLTKAVI